jgi:hypothetical protein
MSIFFIEPVTGDDAFSRARDQVLGFAIGSPAPANAVPRGFLPLEQTMQSLARRKGIAGQHETFVMVRELISNLGHDSVT